MLETAHLHGRFDSDVRCERPARITRSLLGYGVVAGPFYVVVVLVQALLRPGFNLGHDDASLLSNGAFGWVQIANFLITGLMVVAFAVGLSRALVGGRAATWGPRLIGLYGIGLIGAGLFTADPMNGFPPGTPSGAPTLISIHGMLHIVMAAIGFLGLVAACFIIARRFSADGLRRRAWFSRGTGILFLLAFIGVASGSGSSMVVLGFWIGLLVAWAWIATVAIDHYRRLSSAAHPVAMGVVEP